MEVDEAQQTESVLLERINHAANLNSKSLQFCWEPALTRLPPEIQILGAHLEELLLYKNGLTYLSPELGSLSRLAKLELSFNNLHNLIPGLPTKGHFLPSLQELYLNDNQLNFLPQGISVLSSLRILQLSSNHLRSLPPELGYLTALETLQLEKNQLESLPSTISRLHELKTLLLNDNKLIDLPDEIGALSCLQTLDLHSNNLVSLPSTVGFLSALESLEVHNNNLRRIPPEIGLLASLEQLQLFANKLVHIPDEIGLLSSLRILGLSNNPITILPFEAKRLTKLRILHLPKECCLEKQSTPKINLQQNTHALPLIDICMQVVRDVFITRETNNNNTTTTTTKPSRKRYQTIRKKERELLPRLGLPEDLEHKLLSDGRKCCGCERMLYGVPAWYGWTGETVCKGLVKLELLYCAACGAQKSSEALTADTVAGGSSIDVGSGGGSAVRGGGRNNNNNNNRNHNNNNPPGIETMTQVLRLNAGPNGEPVKRGRGRPRLNKAAGDDQQQEGPNKRRRGGRGGRGGGTAGGGGPVFYSW